jgi:hypothetical protein
MRPAGVILAGMTLVLAAGCAAQPMTRERAARLCAEEAREADGISGRVGIGAGSEGGAAEGRLTITSAIFDPQSEEEALEACIARLMAGDRSRPARAGLTIAIEGEL